jgi:hypothetical protein
MITIKELAQKAVQQSKNKANWIAIDKGGFVYAFSVKPIINGDVWDIAKFEDDLWYIAECPLPQDWTKELYEIPKLLSDDNQ